MLVKVATGVAPQCDCNGWHREMNGLHIIIMHIMGIKAIVIHKSYNADEMDAFSGSRGGY